MKLSGAILFLTAVAHLAGQTNRGSISGTVFDKTGAVIPGAAVVVKNLGTNQESRATTSGAGGYSVISLDPVDYSITVEARGFKKAVISRFKVDTASAATVDITLEAGAVATEVTVTADAAQINVESATTSTTVSERQISDIPLVNRSVLDLALSQPGVNGEAGSEDPGLSANLTVPGFNLSVNGGRPGSTSILADGVNNTGVSLARSMVSFSPETVQEFTVQTSVYSAEYGQTSGGIISVTTKTGTNRVMGTALWFNRNPVFAAAPFTTATRNRSKPTLKYNQFSLAVGGPIVVPKLYDGRSKTFFFAAYEPRYRRDFLAQDTLVPTMAMRQGDFSNMVATASGYVPAEVAQQFGVTPNGDATIYNQFSVFGSQFQRAAAPAGGYQPFPNNVIPRSMLDPSALKAVEYIAQPGAYYINSGGTISNLFNPRLLRQNDNRYTMKVDHNFSAANRLSGRYTMTPIVKTQYTPTSITSDGADYSAARQAMLTHTYTFANGFVNDLRLNYTRGRFSTVPAPKYDPFSGENLNAELGLPNVTRGGVPLLPFIGTGGSSTQENREERYNITDIVYFNRGRMAWKFGVDLNHSLQNQMPLFGAVGGRYAFGGGLTNSTGGAGATGGNGFAQFMLGVPDSVDLRTTLVPYYYRWNSAAAFVQNDWKVRPNFTLNLGMRWALNLPRTEKYDHQGVFRPDLAKDYPLQTPLTLLNGRVVDSVTVVPFAFVGKGGRSRYMSPAQWTDFEPRFGFAWSPGLLRHYRVTLRGGYGLSHAPITGGARGARPDFSGTQSFNSTTGQRDPNFLMRLGANPPVIIPQTVDQAIGVPPEDGITYLGSLAYRGQGFAVSDNVKTPYSQNWNFTIAWQARERTTVELAYLGNKGTHLFLPGHNINPKDVSLLSALNAANLNQADNIPDPLGRVNTAGQVITVQRGTLGSPYLGFLTFNQLYDASANSIRHSAYVHVSHRPRSGLIFTANYTMGKSIDDASDSGVDSFVLTTGRTSGNLVAGAGRRTDRSVSTFDVRHVVNGTLIYDLPFGRGKLLSGTWKPIREAVGGWTVSSVARFTSGFPARVTLVDGNQLTDTTHTLRPNMVSGAPLVNPLYNRSCPIGNNCQPYLNPSAFSRPAVGELGDAPRTLDGARGPWQQFFDLSIQKNFSLSEDGKRRVQFRVDFLNALNHPVFRVGPNDSFIDILSQPSGNAISTGDYNNWATANRRPLSSTPEGTALLGQINANINAQRVNNVLPTNFFAVKLPENFYGTPATNFDLTTVEGFKMFRLRQAYNTSFGTLFQSGQPRYIQFGLKLFF